MNNDPSRIQYRYSFSKSSQKPVEHQTFPCKEAGCNEFFYTVNKLAEHHLDRHSSIPSDLQKFNVQEHRNGSV